MLKYLNEDIKINYMLTVAPTIDFSNTVNLKSKIN